jgi:hypothetical protein
MARKEVNPDEIDESFIVSSFKNKERLNRPGFIAQSPEAEKEKEESSPETLREDTPKEDARRKRLKQPTYESIFLQEVDIATRSGKLVSIRQTYHERIQRIVQTIGGNKVSIFSYIDNVLTGHFAAHQDEITRLYNKHKDDGLF